MTSYARCLFSLVVPLVVIAVLGGCSAVMTQSMGGNRDFEYLTHGRVTHVVVRGDPFGAGQGSFANQVVAAMQGHDWNGRARFRTSPGPRSHKYVKVVMLFNGPDQTTAFQLCETPERFRSVDKAPRLHILAAFCVSGHPERVVEASASGVKTPHTAKFAQLIARTTVELSRSARRGTDNDNGDK